MEEAWLSRTCLIPEDTQESLLITLVWLSLRSLYLMPSISQKIRGLSGWTKMLIGEMQEQKLQMITKAAESDLRMKQCCVLGFCRYVGKLAVG